jgi:hypothetical protein
VDVGAAVAGRNFAAVQAAFRARFPKAHRDFPEASRFQRTLAITSCRGGAGALDCQNRNDLLGIPFLSSETEHGKVIVHGHTPSVAQKFVPIESELTLPPMRLVNCLILKKDQRRFSEVTPR